MLLRHCRGHIWTFQRRDQRNPCHGGVGDGLQEISETFFLGGDADLQELFQLRLSPDFLYIIFLRSTPFDWFFDPVEMLAQVGKPGRRFNHCFEKKLTMGGWSRSNLSLMKLVTLVDFEMFGQKPQDMPMIPIIRIYYIYIYFMYIHHLRTEKSNTWKMLISWVLLLLRHPNELVRV